MYNISFDNEGYITAKVTLTNGRYFANEIRVNYFESEEETYISEKESQGKNFEIKNYKISNPKTFEKPLVETFSMIGDNSFKDQTNIKLFPAIFPTIKSNPFNLNDRLFPVDYGYQRFITQRINIAIQKAISDQPSQRHRSKTTQ